MRSSKSATDPLAPGPVGFAHRGRHGPYPFVENSLTAFAAALEMGAGIECDARLTADGRIVIFHDTDTARLCGQARIVERSTLAELQALPLGDQPMPTLEQLLALADGRAPILIELKHEGFANRWIAPLRRALAGYRGPVGVMSFSAGLIGWVRNKLPAVRRGLVLRNRRPAVSRWMGIWFARPHFLAVDREACARRWAQRQRGLRPLYCWTVTTPEQRRQLEPVADALIWEGDGRP